MLYTSGEKDVQSKIEREILRTSEDITHYPLGLAYLYSVLEKEGHELQLLSLANNDEDDCDDKVKAALKSFAPDIVCFQILSFNRVSSFRMIEYIHTTYPRIDQVIGGIHTTIMYEQILTKYPYAIAVLGEGELTISDLVKELTLPDRSLSRVDGIAFYENSAVTVTKPRELISDLDAIPFPKHEIFFKGKRTTGAILTTRGCPSRCSFCCLKSISRGRVRLRSVSNIIEEIREMIKKFPKMTEIFILDDTFFIDNQRVIKFCDEIIRLKIKINFSCNARVKPLNEEMAEKLERANFKRIYFGIESGDDKILEKCHKGITREDIIRAYRLFSKTKIHVAPFLIIGLPGETIDSILKTCDLLKKLQKIKYAPDCDQVGLLKIFPGTEVYEIAKTSGLMDDTYWLTDRPIPIFTVENSLDRLKYYEKVFSYHTSQVTAFCTWTGFKAQFFLIPYHLRFIFSSTTNLKFFLIRVIKFSLPSETYERLKKRWKLFFYKLSAPENRT